MKKIGCIILIVTLIRVPVIAQITNREPGNNSLSIQYDPNPAQKNIYVAAKASSNNDLLNGIGYNAGLALKFSIYSPYPYYISLSGLASSYVPAAFTLVHHPDINNYIFYRVVDNETGGYTVESGNTQGEVLGENTHTIISNCPPNLVPGNNNPVPAKFGLLFRVNPGYSLSPGNYTTNIIITATFQ
jgi:hypothetical protein